MPVDLPRGAAVIHKERLAAEHVDVGSRAKAGAAAELQMAHYLRRAFAAEAGVAVLNDLRLPNPDQPGDFAQVDHLLIHRFGLIVVESKSVGDRVTVLPDGQWVRGTAAGGEGMASPVLQARRQAGVVRRVLAARFDPLGLGGLAGVPIDVLVAISDGGILDRSSGANVPEACKADQVPDRLVTRVRQLATGPKSFDAPRRQQLADHLSSLHTPRRRTPLPAASRPPDALPTPAQPSCAKCGSRALHAQHGRYGYFYRCLTCTGNTRLPRTCPACGADGQRVRKERLNFFVDCGQCGRATRVHTNAELTDLEGPDDAVPT